MNKVVGYLGTLGAAGWVAIFGFVLGGLLLAFASELRDPTILPSERRPALKLDAKPDSARDASVEPDVRDEAEPQTIPAAAAMRRRYRGTALLPLPAATAEATALFLAKLYFVEVEGPREPDLAIMAHVLAYRRKMMERSWDRPVSLLEAIDRYSGGRLRLPPGARSERYRWILSLTANIEEPPPGFPDGRSWPRTLASWRQTMQHARDHVAGELPPDPCRGQAGYWGGRGRLAETTDAPRGSMEPLVCHPDQILRTYSTARTRRRSRDS